MSNNGMLKIAELIVQLIQAAAWPLVIFAIFKALMKMGALKMLENVLQRTDKLELPGIKFEMRAAALEADVKILTSDLPTISKPESSTTETQTTSIVIADQQIEPWQKERIEYAEKLALRQRAESIDRMKNFYRQIMLDTWRGIESGISTVLTSHGVFSPENDPDGRELMNVLEKQDIVPNLLIQLARLLWDLKNEAFYSQVPISQAAATSYQNTAREFSKLISAYKKQDT